MTNITKKRQTTIWDRPPPPSSVADSPTIEELQARNAQLERKLRKYKGVSWPLTCAWLTLYCRNAEDYMYNKYQTYHLAERWGWEL